MTLGLADGTGTAYADYSVHRLGLQPRTAYELHRCGLTTAGKLAVYDGDLTKIRYMSTLSITKIAVWCVRRGIALSGRAYDRWDHREEPRPG